MGQGRSFKRVKEFSHLFEEIILCNYSETFIRQRVLNDKELVKILQEKECTLFCNANKVGFNNLAFDNFNVKKCMVNRVKPTENWHLWKMHKATQKKGLWYHDENIPPFEKDLPYFYKWRGPGPESPDGKPVPQQNVNWPDMTLSNGFKIEHLSENIEMYLFEPTRDRLETNMGLYFTALYSIIDLNKTHLYYAGIDFYDSIGDGEGWDDSRQYQEFLNRKRYQEVQETVVGHGRVQMEGAHMKILLNDYLARYFPKVTFELYTHANFKSTKKNVKVRKKEET